MRLARYFGTSDSVWLRLQVRYDLESAKNTLGPRIEREVKVFQDLTQTAGLLGLSLVAGPLALALAVLMYFATQFALFARG